MEFSETLLEQIEIAAQKLAPGIDLVEIPESLGMRLVVPDSSEASTRLSNQGVVVGEVTVRDGRKFLVCNK